MSTEETLHVTPEATSSQETVKLTTMVVSIGNSDDKLSQRKWSHFVNDVKYEVYVAAYRVHFYGCSDGGKEWQNACFVFEIDVTRIEAIKAALQKLRIGYLQESIAVTIGETQFV